MGISGEAVGRVLNALLLIAAKTIIIGIVVFIIVRIIESLFGTLFRKGNGL